MLSEDKFIEEVLEFHSFSKKGEGRAYLTKKQGLNIQVDVPHTLVGDTAKVRIRKKKRKKNKGRLLEIISPSPWRRKPVCPHSRICGGCTWHEMKYEKQLEEKEKILLDAFDKLLDKQTVEIFPIIPFSQQWRYRNKMEFSFSENKGGEKYLGLTIANAKSFIFNVETCFLANKWFSSALQAVRNWWKKTDLHAYFPPKDKGHLRSITMREGIRTQEKLIMLKVSGNKEYVLTEEDKKGFVQAIKDTGIKNISIFLCIQKIQKGQSTTYEILPLTEKKYITEKLKLSFLQKSFPKEKELIFKISPTSFFQTNTIQAEKLYNLAIKLAEVKKNSIVFDLFSGTGSIAMAFSLFVKKVIAIEINPSAVLDAKKNIEENKLSNIFLYEGDVGEVLKNLSSKKELFTPPDIVVVDPPRSGLNLKAIEQIKNLKPKKIIYISCNPYTQSENIKELQNLYILKKIQPIDQFPHTHHIENIAILEREA